MFHKYHKFKVLFIHFTKVLLLRMYLSYFIHGSKNCTNLSALHIRKKLNGDQSGVRNKKWQVVTSEKEMMKPVNKKQNSKHYRIWEQRGPVTQLWRPHCSIISCNIHGNNPEEWGVNYYIYYILLMKEWN